MAMTMQRQDRLMLAVMNETPPTDEEWTRWFELGKPRLGMDLRLIIEVYGHVGPNARQRQQLAPTLGKIDLRTAVMSDSMVVRGLVTAVSWLGVPNSAFSSGRLEQAARYLELTPDELARARVELPKLRIAAGVRVPPPSLSARPGRL